eukprot:5661813-Pleurochrysis_carterae.AAC.1
MGELRVGAEVTQEARAMPGELGAMAWERVRRQWADGGACLCGHEAPALIGATFHAVHSAVNSNLRVVAQRSGSHTRRVLSESELRMLRLCTPLFRPC